MQHYSGSVFTSSISLDHFSLVMSACRVKDVFMEGIDDPSSLITVLQQTDLVGKHHYQLAASGVQPSTLMTSHLYPPPPPHTHTYHKGLLQLLYAILLHDGPPRHFSSPPTLPQYTLSIATAAMKALNNIAILNLRMVQVSVIAPESIVMLLRPKQSLGRNPVTSLGEGINIDTKNQSFTPVCHKQKSTTQNYTNCIET